MDDLKKGMNVSIGRILRKIQEECNCDEVRSYNIFEELLYGYDIEDIIIEHAKEMHKQL